MLVNVSELSCCNEEMVIIVKSADLLLVEFGSPRRGIFVRSFGGICLFFWRLKPRLVEVLDCAQERLQVLGGHSLVILAKVIPDLFDEALLLSSAVRVHKSKLDHNLGASVLLDS